MMQTERQTTNHVFMVRPQHFGSNPQTAASNAFQQVSHESPATLRKRAIDEFDAMVDRLREAGITPMVFDDTADPVKPDAVFPNNWVSFHEDGNVFLYPLEAADRRPERRLDIVESLSSDWGFHVHDIVDLTDLEHDGLYLEGTGSMVLDRSNHVAYAALSTRTHMDALAEFAQLADYEITAFDAVDANGQAIYHTNVMMAIGKKVAVVCTESIANANKSAAVVGRLAATGRDVVEISMSQMNRFAGNLLELVDNTGAPVIALSRSAFEVLSEEQRERIGSGGRLLPMDIATIEHIGGGSVRCMLGEVFLPHPATVGNA